MRTRLEVSYAFCAARVIRQFLQRLRRPQHSNSPALQLLNFYRAPGDLITQVQRIRILVQREQAALLLFGGAAQTAHQSGGARVSYLALATASAVSNGPDEAVVTHRLAVVVRRAARRAHVAALHDRAADHRAVGDLAAVVRRDALARHR